MSERNVELHRRADEAFDTRDVEAYLALCDSQIELNSGLTVPGGAAYHGHDGVRSWHRDVEDAFGDDIRVEPESYFDSVSTRCRSMICVGVGGTVARRSRGPMPM